MTEQEFQQGLARAAEMQRRAGWSEASIESYAQEMRQMLGGNLECVLLVGAGLAQDNSRHGVAP